MKRRSQGVLDHQIEGPEEAELLCPCSVGGLGSASALGLRCEGLPTPIAPVPYGECRIPTISSSKGDASANGWVFRRVDYVVGEHPMADILSLSGGLGRPIFVEELLSGGIAESAGIRRGHELVGVAAFPKFRDHRGSELIAMLPTPTALIFCEKPQPKEKVQVGAASEARIVRHRAQEHDVGLSANTLVCEPTDGKFKLLDEVSFQPTAPLWLVSPRPSGHEGLCQLGRTEAQRLVALAINQASDPCKVPMSDPANELDEWFPPGDSFWSTVIPDTPDESDVVPESSDQVSVPPSNRVSL